MSDTGQIAKLLWEYWVPLHTKRLIRESLPKMSENSDIYAEKVFMFLATAHDIGKASPVFQGKAKFNNFRYIWENIENMGLHCYTQQDKNAKALTHALISQAILERAGMDRSLADIIGGHHGKPLNDGQDIEHAYQWPQITGINNGEWERVQCELIDFALKEAGLDKMPHGKLSITAQVLLSGLLIMADWLASGEGFPLLSYDNCCGLKINSKERAEEAWQQIDLPEFRRFSDFCSPQELFSTRFGIAKPRPIQDSAVKAVQETAEPGIMIIEAPMGEGKTEAALAAAEIMANTDGLSGVYFALPTQATSDGIFKRIENWIRKLHKDGAQSIFLAHGKAGFNKDYEGIKLRSNIIKYDDLEEGEQPQREEVIINDWTQGRKKGLLSDFVVGTVDQILMCGLKQKHLALRHLGITNKVVIIDECHAYDTYMSSYLFLVLKWLGAYKVPVILLSATLPKNRREKLLAAYKDFWGCYKKEKKNKSFLNVAAMRNKLANGNGIVLLPTKKALNKEIDKIPYPFISYTDGLTTKESQPLASGEKHDVKIIRLPDDKLIETLVQLLKGGGCAGIIRNTVQQAQETANELSQIFGYDKVKLLHSRFISCDRVAKEAEVRKLLGPPQDAEDRIRPRQFIVVGTQVMEQSLDVDFDVLFTDICPMDLLLQRIGRLHRHKRMQARPIKLQRAVCFVMGFEENNKFAEGSTRIYGDYLLLRTKAFLANHILIPGDIPKLVQETYEDGFEQETINKLAEDSKQFVEDQYKEAKNKYMLQQEIKQQKARTFQIMGPKQQDGNLMGWLKADFKDKTGKRGEATVRDIDNSLEVIVVVKKHDGYMYTLNKMEGYPQFANTKIIFPNEELAKIVAGCSVSLPRFFTASYKIDQTIAELEQIALDNHLDNWYESSWLEGELFVVLDEAGETVLGGKRIKYDTRYGLEMLEEV
jgi:CRISPR-associated endonuclease/helicase Cas3